MYKINWFINKNYTIENFENFEDFSITQPSKIKRTHKAWCPLCYSAVSSYNPNNRVIICSHCNKVKIPLIQRKIRGFLKKNLKLQKLKNLSRYINKL